MNHVDAELLAGLALGDADSLSADQRRHLETCRGCQAELTELRDITRIGRDTDPIIMRVPGSDLLGRIDAELAGDAVPPAATATEISSVPVPTPTSTSIPDRTPTRRSRRLVLLAAAAGLILGIGGTIAYEQATRSDERVLATSTLSALPGQTGTGRAELVRQDGVDKLRVQVDTAPAGREFRELWLINTDGRRMISLGVLDASGRGTYPLPGQLSGPLQDYTIVDVSREPYDGDAAHSQASVVRGTLT